MSDRTPSLLLGEIAAAVVFAEATDRRALEQLGALLEELDAIAPAALQDAVEHTIEVLGGLLAAAPAPETRAEVGA